MVKETPTDIVKWVNVDLFQGRDDDFPSSLQKWVQDVRFLSKNDSFLPYFGVIKNPWSSNLASNLIIWHKNYITWEQFGPKSTEIWITFHPLRETFCWSVVSNDPVIWHLLEGFLRDLRSRDEAESSKKLEILLQTSHSTLT